MGDDIGVLESMGYSGVLLFVGDISQVVTKILNGGLGLRKA